MTYKMLRTCLRTARLAGSDGLSVYPSLAALLHNNGMSADSAKSEQPKKPSVDDFEFGKTLGEGSFGDVRFGLRADNFSPSFLWISNAPFIESPLANLETVLILLIGRTLHSQGNWQIVCGEENRKTTSRQNWQYQVRSA